ncbi:urea transporter [Streptomyces sp. CC208A]|uniref:urea transporter n=1 Tax=Streptomyces sp. CC208A TaxID=3044573 RepID=UPI0024A8BF0D|nr:urea transporter [Streptomyces sp. CC208A]
MAVLAAGLSFLISWLMEYDAETVADGLIAFNPILTAMALGGFLRRRRRGRGFAVPPRGQVNLDRFAARPVAGITRRTRRLGGTGRGCHVLRAGGFAKAAVRGARRVALDGSDRFRSGSVSAVWRRPGGGGRLKPLP